MQVKKYKVKDLTKAEYNPRVISEKQFEDLKKSISEFGITEPILINTNKKRKGVIISGHQRYDACIALSMEEVPCVEVNLTEEKEKELNIKMNKLGGEFDFDILEEYFSKDELIDWGFEDFEFDIADTVSGNFNTEDVYVPKLEPTQSEKDVSEKDIEDKKDSLDKQFEGDSGKGTVKVVCPHCFKEFDVQL